MHEDERKAVREKLLAIEARLADEATAAIERVAERVRAPDEISDLPTHAADQDAEGLDRELTLEASRERMIDEIEHALARLDGGTYGKCQDCGRDIAAQRLEALPFAVRCVACQERHEQS